MLSFRLACASSESPKPVVHTNNIKVHGSVVQAEHELSSVTAAACTNRGDESEEEYDFEYSDEEVEETDVDLENSYYSAKVLKGEDPQAAVEAFREASDQRMISLSPAGREEGLLFVSLLA